MILKEPDTKGTYQGRQTTAQERGGDGGSHHVCGATRGSVVPTWPQANRPAGSGQNDIGLWPGLGVHQTSTGPWLSARFDR